MKICALRVQCRTCFWRAAIYLYLAFVVFHPRLSQAIDYLSHDEPVKSSASEIPDPLEHGFSEPDRHEGEEIIPDDQLASLLPFLGESSLSANLRNYYLHRNKFDNSNLEAWALGGHIDYQTGKVWDLFSVGASFYGSGKLAGANSRDGTLLLRSGQQGYSALGQLYGQFEYRSHELTLGRQEYNLPFVNRQDNRMSPNTFEGYSLFAKSERNPRLQYALGYIDKMKKRNASSFVPISEAAGAEGSSKGMIFSGARYHLDDAFTVGGINYFVPDTLNIVYAQSGYVYRSETDIEFKLDLQYADQRSVGDDLLTGDYFSTHLWGGSVAMSYSGIVLTGALTGVSKGEEFISPFGSHAGFNSVIINDYNRAGERAWRLGVLMDLSRVGLSGLSVFSNFVAGDRAIDVSSGTNLPDRDEVNLTLDYLFEEGAFRDLSLRLRLAHVKERRGERLEDYRIIINYPINFL